jgi:hypothetical protein
VIAYLAAFHRREDDNADQRHETCRAYANRATSYLRTAQMSDAVCCRHAEGKTRNWQSNGWQICRRRSLLPGCDRGQEPLCSRLEATSTARAGETGSVGKGSPGHSTARPARSAVAVVGSVEGELKHAERSCGPAHRAGYHLPARRSITSALEILS